MAVRSSPVRVESEPTLVLVEPEPQCVAREFVDMKADRRLRIGANPASDSIRPPGSRAELARKRSRRRSHSFELPPRNRIAISLKRSARSPLDPMPSICGNVEVAVRHGVHEKWTARRAILLSFAPQMTRVRALTFARRLSRVRSMRRKGARSFGPDGRRSGGFCDDFRVDTRLIPEVDEAVRHGRSIKH